MTTPPYLKKGDKIAIVATARKVLKEELQFAVDVFNYWGLEVVYGKNLFNSDHQFSGTDAERAEDLQNALNDTSIKAIIGARGGYGTVRIIDKIDFTSLQSQPKWLIGFSDITVLHSEIFNRGIETIHATMAFSFSKNVDAVDTLRKALFGEALHYEIKSSILNRIGNAEAELVGGNLSLMYALAGTSSDIRTDGKILFIEDLDEYLYHMDRMMMNLKRSGKLQGLAGLVVGGMTDMKDNPIPFGKTAEEIVLDAVKEYHYPVCFDFPAGHVDRNLALILGRRIKLEVTVDKGSLFFSK